MIAVLRHQAVWTITGIASAVAILGLASATARADVLEEMNRQLVASVAQVAPAVVAVRCHWPTGAPAGPEGPVVWASGVVIDDQGHVVTVGIEAPQQAGRIIVMDSSERQHTATFIGYDPREDITLLKVTDLGLKPVRLAADSSLPAGSLVIAVGNPYGLSGSVALGTVSACNREVKTARGERGGLIQFTAPINPGDSGGCLANLKGEMIGLVTSSLEPPLWQHEWRVWDSRGLAGWASGGPAQAIAFALPAKRVLAAVEAIRKGQTSESGYLGVYGAEPTPDQMAGAVLADVIAGSPAAQAGLRAGDIIVRYGDKPIRNFAELREAARSTQPGTPVTLVVMRGDQKLNLTVTVGRRPSTPPPLAGWSSYPWLSWPPGQTPWLSLDFWGQPLMLGVSPQALTPALRQHLGVPADKGVLLAEVMPHSPAHQAGLRQQDVILRIDDQETNSPEDLHRVVEGLTPGSRVTVHYLRDGKPAQCVVELGSWKGGRLFDFRWPPGTWPDRPGRLLPPKTPPSQRPAPDRLRQLEEQLQKLRQQMEDLLKKQRPDAGTATQPQRI